MQLMVDTMALSRASLEGGIGILLFLAGLSVGVFLVLGLWWLLDRWLGDSLRTWPWWPATRDWWIIGLTVYLIFMHSFDHAENAALIAECDARIAQTKTAWFEEARRYVPGPERRKFTRPWFTWQAP